MSDHEHGSTEEDNDLQGRKRRRGSYKCSRCGQPKKGHICSEPTLTTQIPLRGIGNQGAVTPTSISSPASMEGVDQTQLFQLINQLNSRIQALMNENNELRSRLNQYEARPWLTPPEASPIASFDSTSQILPPYPQTPVPLDHGMHVSPSHNAKYAEERGAPFAGGRIEIEVTSGGDPALPYPRREFIKTQPQRSYPTLIPRVQAYHHQNPPVPLSQYSHAPQSPQPLQSSPSSSTTTSSGRQPSPSQQQHQQQHQQQQHQQQHQQQQQHHRHIQHPQAYRTRFIQHQSEPFHSHLNLNSPPPQDQD